MISAILVLAAILGCLTLAGFVSRNLFTPNTGRRGRFSRLDWLRACTRLKREHCWRWYLKLRARFPVVRIAHPDGPPPFPASGAARYQPGSAGLPAIDPKVLAHLRRRMAGLPAAARNGVPLQDRPRKTVDVIICDPAVMPVVPRWYQAWLEGRWSE